MYQIKTENLPVCLNYGMIELTTGRLNSSGNLATDSVAVEHPHPITATGEVV